MKDFAINYAYDGFLYSPLLIAKKLGFLPNHAQLVHRNGDEEAITSLGGFGDDLDNWFAICDPFAHTDLSRVAVPVGEKADSICIVGALVGRLPVWLYGLNPDCGPFANERDIKEQKSIIKRVVCYEKYNTGYLIGKHVSDVMDPGLDKTYEVSFGSELKGLKPNDLAVTSDVLAVAESLRAKNGYVKCDLFRNCPDLDPFLFTAILTRRSIVEQHLPTVLGVLSGLQKAVRLFETDTLLPSEINFLAERFAGQIPHATTDEARQAIVRDGVRLLSVDKIYSGNLDIATAEKGYNNARAEWSQTLKRQYTAVENQKEPIPSLLMQEGWRCDQDLASEFANAWKLKLSGGKGAGAAEPVLAVANAWRDHGPTIQTVTRNWLGSESTKQILTEMICPPTVRGSGTSLVKAGFQTLTPYIILAYLPLFAVILMVVAISGHWAIGLPVLESSLALMVLLFALGYYLHPGGRNTPFWVAASCCVLVQVAITVVFCRDTFYPETQQWGHHEWLWGATIAIFALVLTRIMSEPDKADQPTDKR